MAAGLAVSLARPGGNITGVQTQTSQFAGKQLALLTEIVPRLSRVDLFKSGSEDPKTFAAYLREAEAGANVLRIRLRTVTIPNGQDFDAAFVAARGQGTEAVILVRSAVLITHLKIATALALKHGFPTISDFPSLVTAGGLMSYSTNWEEMARATADIIDRLFRGAKASEIPIQQATTFQLAINLKTAKALGLTIPPSLLQRADQVIE